MAYIPKNKIQTNLYTSGEQYAYVEQPRVFYTGYYHKLYNGKVYTGRTPNDIDIKELILVNKSIIAEDLGYEFSFPPFPPYNPLLPTSQDYQNGEFTRYFLIRRNQPIFLEINKDTYDKYISKKPTVYWRTYRPFSLKWQLTGDIARVTQVNKDITSLVETRENVLGLGLYLRENWIQYYRFTKAENLTTDGKGDFVLKTVNGNLYSGTYHVDPNKGYIAGPTPNEGSQTQLYGYYKNQAITVVTRSPI